MFSEYWKEGSKKDVIFRPHLEEDERAFRIIKKGLQIIKDDPEALKKTLAFVERYLTGQKASVWKAILTREGFEDKIAWLYRVSSFKELPEDIKDWWTIYIQDHPFSAIFAERIRKLQKEKRISWHEAVKRLLSIELENSY